MKKKIIELKEKMDYIISHKDSNLTGKRLKKCRQKKKFTQKELAEIIGISIPAYIKYETGETKTIPTDKLHKICSILDTDPSYLLGWNELPAITTISGLIMGLISTGFTLDYVHLYAFTGTSFFFGTALWKFFVYYLKNKKPELTEEEKKEYQRFKNATLSYLDTKELFKDSPEDIQEIERHIKGLWMAHKVKGDLIKLEEKSKIEEIEIIDK